MARRYIVNSPGIFTSKRYLDVNYMEIDKDRFCDEIKLGATSAIGHESTAKLISQLCKVDIKPNRVMIDLQPGDVMLGIKLAFRPEEGKIYSDSELEELYKSGKIKFFRIRAFDEEDYLAIHDWVNTVILKRNE